MIRKYTFGTPIPTDAVVQSLPAEKGPVPFLDTQAGGDGSVTFSLSLHPEEVIFGLGQAVRGIDKRGHRYESWNSDVFNHTEERPNGRISLVNLVQVLSMPMEYAAPSGSGDGSGVSVPGR